MSLSSMRFETESRLWRIAIGAFAGTGLIERAIPESVEMKIKIAMN
jgi:hypothetical protein